MLDMVIEKSGINLQGLDGELRTALGEATYGISVARGFVTIHWIDELAQPALMQQARQIVLNHDANLAIVPEVVPALTVEEELAQLRQQIETLALRVKGTADER